MSSEFAELLSIWHTEAELQEHIREFDNFVQAKLRGRNKGNKEGYKEGFKDGFKVGFEKARREIAENLIQSGMALEQVSQITELSVETLEYLQT